MRGSLSLFSDIFEEKLPAKKTSRKGRSAARHHRRNECLISRYYYYGKFSDKRYSKIIEDLSEEFFLSPVTIPDVIQENLHILKGLRDDQPQKSWFKRKWPHLSW